MRGVMRRALPLLVLALAAPAAPAAAGDPDCTASYVPAHLAAPHPLRFGIDPELAGSAGTSQGQVKPENPRRRAAALRALRPRGRELVLRVNRLFWSAGEPGLKRFARKVAADSRAGYAVEVQVRYHPSKPQEGDLRAWER